MKFNISNEWGEVFHADDNVMDLPCKTIKMAKKNT
tara:strand:+ start:415 stop:519 length:105 start_codon:yes stop_codon:yes gene_type:complete